MKKIVIFAMSIILGFCLGMHLAAAYHSSQNINVGQAIELVAMPIEEYEPIPEPEITYLGKYTITAFCSCSKCCGKWANPQALTASGEVATEGITVGADWATLPKGTEIYIEGVGSRIVEDKPAKWIVDKYDGRILDLYYFSHEDALAFGKREVDVWEVKY